MGVTQIFTMMSKIVAFQNERPAFVSIILYLSIVYAFLGDILIFDEKPLLITTVGCIIILALNLNLVLGKLYEQTRLMLKQN